MADGTNLRLLCLLCVVQVAASATSWSLVQSPASSVCLIVCDLQTSTLRQHVSELSCCVTSKVKRRNILYTYLVSLKISKFVFCSMYYCVVLCIILFFCV